MDDMNIKSAIEAILFAAGEPVPAARISLILGVSEEAVYAAAKELSDEYSFNLRGIRLLKLDKNLQLCSSPEYASVINTIQELRSERLVERLLDHASGELLVILIARSAESHSPAKVFQLTGTDVGGHDQNRVLEINPAT